MGSLKEASSKLEKSKDVQQKYRKARKGSEGRRKPRETQEKTREVQRKLKEAHTITEKPWTSAVRSASEKPRTIPDGPTSFLESVG